MGDRWYDAQLGRWISADTIVPGSANPKSFNRYMYVLGNPLRYTDPSGHFSDEQIDAWTEQGAEYLRENHLEIYELLRAAHFWDSLWANNGGKLQSIGLVGLNDHGYLKFGDLSLQQVIDSDVLGWSLTRNFGNEGRGETFLVHEIGEGFFGGEFGDSRYMPYEIYGGSHTVTPGQAWAKGIPTTYRRVYQDVVMGILIGKAVPDVEGPAAEIIGGVMGFGKALIETAIDTFAEPPGGHQKEDIILTYHYQNRDPMTGHGLSKQGWTETTIIRNNQVLSVTWEPYDNN